MKKNTLIFAYTLCFMIFAVAGLAAGGKAETTSEEEKSYPFTGKTLLQILDTRKDVTFIAEALTETRLADQMEKLDGYTLFVPTDDAIKRLPQLARTAMMRNPQALLDVLTAQMLKGIVVEEELSRRTQVTTMGNITMDVGTRGKRITLNNSDIIATDLFGDGFLVHIVTGIIVPEISVQ
jgi:uncharacterized surface protein with fasciclin (FAS1) repeats